MGKKIDQDRLGEVEKGKTTYEELVQRYGKPNSVLIRDDGTKQAAYIYEQAQSRVYNYIPVVGAFLRGGDEESAHTVFEFDSAGRLVSYHSYAGQTGTGTGFVSGSRQK
jgi:hypothetical protein